MAFKKVRERGCLISDSPKVPLICFSEEKENTKATRFEDLLGTVEAIV